jgi:hypothetical protein
VTAISDLMQALRYATTEDKAEIYPALKAGTRHSISAVLIEYLGRVMPIQNANRSGRSGRLSGVDRASWRQRLSPG